MRLVTLYISAGTQDQVPEARVAGIAAGYFESFTLLPGSGYYRHQRESMWVLIVATQDVGRVLALAQEYRQAFDQEAIGVEYEDRYFRCTAHTTVSDLIMKARAAENREL
jgi:hypothetical protein